MSVNHREKDTILFSHLKDEEVTYFTGFLSRTQLQNFLEEIYNFSITIIEQAQELSNLLVIDQLIMTLMKIKHNYEDVWLQVLYKLSLDVYLKIFSCWIDSIYR